MSYSAHSRVLPVATPRPCVEPSHSNRSCIQVPLQRAGARSLTPVTRSSRCQREGLDAR
jgi:hypothetical protein